MTGFIFKDEFLMET